MVGIVELVNILWLRLLGRVLSHKSIPGTSVDYKSVPGAAIDGVDLQNAPASMIYVYPRLDARRKTSIVSIDTYDAGTTYRITINGTNYDVSAAGDVNATATALAAAVGAHATIDAAETTATDNKVTIRGVEGTTATYTLAVSIPVGTGTMSIDWEDAESCDVLIMGLPRASTGNDAQPNDLDGAGWVKAGVGSDITGIDWSGLSERINTAPYSRLHLYVTNHNSKDVRVFISPSQEERSSEI